MNPDHIKIIPTSDELQGFLKEAVNRVKTAKPPEEAKNRALGRALQWADSLPASAKPTFCEKITKWPRRFVWTLMGSASVLLILLACSLFWPAGNSSTSWADVVKAIRMKPWVHATDASEEAKEGKAEFWFSEKHGVFAQIADNYYKYYDRNSHVIDEYHTDTKRLVRMSDTSSDLDKTSYREMEATFENLFNGKSASFMNITPGAELIEETCRNFEINGKNFIEYRSKSQMNREGQEPSIIVETIRVDSSTSVPAEMSFVISGKQDGKAFEHKIVYQFDYPNEGPADIYALGVPDSIQRIDRTPKLELSQLIAAVEKSRNEFDSYEAVVMEDGGIYLNKLFSFRHIWRKGVKFRAEMNLANTKELVAEVPVKPTDNLDWCRTSFDQFGRTPLAVCDGKTVYVPKWDETKSKWTNPNIKTEVLYTWEKRASAGAFGQGIVMARATQASPYFPEFYAYPFIQAPCAQLQVEIKPIAPDDPSGTILIEQKSVLEEKYPGQYSNAGIAERYLVDPSRGYITLRHEIDFTGPDAKKEGFFPTQTEIYEMKDYRKTPKGFWYPAKVCRSFRNNSPSASKKIEPAQTYNFFLDFSRILPDELFRPDSASQGGK